jgi:LmeA-like phospholipid-binding
LTRLAIVLILLVVIATVGDLLARSEAERVLASRIRSDTGAQKVSVHIDAFPFIYQAAFSRLSTVEVVADGVPAGVVRLSQVTVHAEQVELDHHALLFNRKVEVVAVDSATVTVLMKESGLPAAVQELDPQVSVVDHHDLVISVFERQVFSVDLSSNRLVPDCDFALDRVPDGYSLSCVVSPVPASLLATLSSSAGRS